jgi:hypothetical protein
VTKLVHVTAGDCTSDALAPAALPGRVIEWADVLYEGPLLADPVAHRAARQAFALAGGWLAPGEPDKLARWDADFDDALATADELCLWYEQDLHCQLCLVHLVARADAAPRRPRLTRPPVDDLVEPRTGLGERDAADLADRFARRVEIPAGGPARAVWDALVRGADDELAALDVRDPAWPHLEAALRRLVLLRRGDRSRDAVYWPTDTELDQAASGSS